MNALSTTGRLSFSIALVVAVMAGLAPVALGQVIEPEKLEVPMVPGTFSVLMTDSEGVESEVFSFGSIDGAEECSAIALSGWFSGALDKEEAWVGFVAGEVEGDLGGGEASPPRGEVVIGNGMDLLHDAGLPGREGEEFEGRLSLHVGDEVGGEVLGVGHDECFMGAGVEDLLGHLKHGL